MAEISVRMSRQRARFVPHVEWNCEHTHGGAKLRSYQLPALVLLSVLTISSPAFSTSSISYKTHDRFYRQDIFGSWQSTAPASSAAGNETLNQIAEHPDAMILHTPPVHFDSKLWRARKHGVSLVPSLIRTPTFIGIHKKDLLQLLGPPVSPKTMSVP